MSCSLNQIAYFDKTSATVDKGFIKAICVVNIKFWESISANQFVLDKIR